MLTNMTVKLFKRFELANIDLGNPVVFIGPNDSGKTTALQALALWDIGVRRWTEKRAGRAAPQQRVGVAINRRDLVALPIPDAKLLWHDLRVRDVRRIGGKQQTRNIRIDIIVEGVTRGTAWKCGLEFDYANEESFYCRPLRLSEDPEPERMEIPDEATEVQVAYLPPMSGLASNEVRLDPGAVNVRIGEGRTAEVLRNLCYQIADRNGQEDAWTNLADRIEGLFGVRLDEPEYVQERGEITMSYQTRGGVQLDLSSSGRGLQQTLLVLGYLSLHRRAVLLLDEPDAHLEILRQRQVYEMLTDATREHGSQIIAASHSEVIMNEAADRDVVVAFVGTPHRIDDRGHQLLKSLKEIGFEAYYQAEQTGWVLYLEGSTDLAILRALALTLDHESAALLERPFVHYVANLPNAARHHFFGLCEAKPDLVGYALFDRLEGENRLQEHEQLVEYAWTKREIENYLAFPPALMSWAKASAQEAAPGELFEQPEIDRREQAMREAIEDLVPRAAQKDFSDPWWTTTKASDDFLDRLFERFFETLALPNLMRKTDYHVLAEHVPDELIDREVSRVLDDIGAVARRAMPVEQEVDG